MTEQHVSKETKIELAKDLVCSFAQTEKGKALDMDQLIDLFHQTFEKVDKSFPEPEKKTVGLGL